MASDIYGGRGGDGGAGYKSGVGGDGGAAIFDAEAGASLTFGSFHVATGGAGGLGNGGSYGGAGIFLAGATGVATVTNQGTVTGGTGGGGSGTGGAGVTFSATGGTLANYGAIQGGAGSPGTTPTGTGGAGVTGAGMTVGNDGSITGGMGATQADAITFQSGANMLALGSISSISGAVDIQSGSLTFNQAVLSSAPTTVSLAAPIIGGGSVIKADTGTLTLSGDNTYMAGTTISAGTLAVSADDNLGDAKGGLTLSGGTLDATLGFSSARAITLSSSPSSIGSIVQVDSGTLTLSGQVTGDALDKTGTGTLTLSGVNKYGGTTISAGALELATNNAAGQGNITFGTPSGSATATLDIDSGAQSTEAFGNGLNDFNASSVLDLEGFAVTNESYTNGTLTLTGNLNGSTRTTTEQYIFKNPSSTAFTTMSDNAGGTDVMVCYAGGTRIRTARGDVAVEDLRVGDLAVTAAGTLRPIRWLGHRSIDCRTHQRRHDVHPVQITAHAFGEGRPVRDLHLSPGHPVLVGADADDEGGHLVPIMCLINGTSVRRVAVDSVTYWHVELDAHDILLAEGLPAESYLDWGDRAFFDEAADFALVNPDFVRPGLAGRCRPVAIDGPTVEAERRRLDTLFATRLVAACDWPASLPFG